jgi:hypothetical protein
MATEEEAKPWGARLEEGGYIIEGINLQNDAMMEAIYTLLEMTKDFPKQSQLRAFIKKQQEPNGKKCFILFIFSLLNLFNLSPLTINLSLCFSTGAHYGQLQLRRSREFKSLA